MNKKVLFLLMNLFCLNLFSQTLSIPETLDYINSNLQHGSAERYSVKLHNDGKLVVDVLKQHPAYKDTYEKSVSYEMNASEIEINKDNNSIEGKVLKFSCKEKVESVFGGLTTSNCIYLNWHGSMAISDFTVKTFDSNKTDRMFNAFTYLLSEISRSDRFNQIDDDPFSPVNLTNRKPAISSSKAQDKIALETYGGVYKVWIKIGGLDKHFILDSGASEISLSTNIERELINSGIIKKKDYIEPALFKLADGSIVKCRRLIIPELTIGDYIVKNVRASIGVSDSPLLLGRSFLDNFRKWSIDNTTRELILEK
ncbi:retropepsin-like aspartic protease [Luteirhabdus pelagi]|uniref:retropepsin-like aspartic protease n=1 Tax=Luteirhabdus pelagi TaxID=2792783 RepID=UPI00193A7147|nr:retropepsin-like aspartic protease [Luteirhabdus pelagi]